MARARRRASGKGVVSSSRGGFGRGFELPVEAPLVAWAFREDKGGGLRPAWVRAWKITAWGICEDIVRLVGVLMVGR